MAIKLKCYWRKFNALRKLRNEIGWDRLISLPLKQIAAAS